MNREELEKAVARVVVMALGWWLDSNLADYGKFSGKSGGELKRVAEVWAVSIVDAKVRFETLEPAARRIASEGGDFPDVGAFITKCKELRGEMFVFVGVELADGRLATREFPVTVPPEERKAILIAELQRKGIELAPAALPTGRTPSPKALAMLNAVRGA